MVLKKIKIAQPLYTEYLCFNLVTNAEGLKSPPPTEWNIIGSEITFENIDIYAELAQTSKISKIGDQ